LRRHHGANTDLLFARLVEVWTAHAPGTRWGLDSHASQVRCRVLAIQGEDDEFFSEAQFTALAALLSAPLETLRIPGSGHYPIHQARN